ncbi:hypothetical protein JS756_21920 [Streptomyces actuosus]|uniref:DUF3558 domain-containing protein n=1 Tax=Streptomyces actuosus TaxID=1885 RepID=A0ABS2VUJ5_STRAS|nr:lipoprotein [Streptomyces actuosus]MBN0046716.1 hypothetical protein [Streptomyces actuosus]
MRGRTGAEWGVAAPVLLAAVLAGCGQPGGEDVDVAATPSATATRASGTAAPSGGSIGAAGTPCPLPVAFDIARGWKAKVVDVQPSADVATEDLVELLHQGPVTLACEIDAKPAGNIGFLRVWTGEPGKADARTVLEGFVDAEKGTSKATYRTFASGGLTGVEVEYLCTSEVLDETKKENALAVVTDRGPVVLHLGGLDDEEHRAMLPAFELARRTLRTP